MFEMQVSFTGSLGKDAVVYTPPSGGKRRINFSVAHSARRKVGDSYDYTETRWVDCTVWERWDGDLMIDSLAGVLQKGAHVLIVGDMYDEKWVSRNDPSRSGVTTRCNVQHLGILAERFFVQAKPHPQRESSGGGSAGWNAPASQQAQPQQQASWSDPDSAQQRVAAQQAWGVPADQTVAQPAAAQAQQQPAAAWGAPVAQQSTAWDEPF